MEELSNGAIVHVKKDNIEYIQFRRLLEYAEIMHCYTIRQHDMNFKIYEDDYVLQKSYSKICEALKLDKANVVKPYQTHTDRIETVENCTQIFNEVDGVITDQKDIVLCTTSADCTSLLFYDPVKHVISDVHSGWRGTVKKIGQKAVKKMIAEYGCTPTDIICCICPHIRKCHFEVDEDVMEIFREEFTYTKNLDRIIEKGRRINGVQKYNIDTLLINQCILKEIGLREENIIDSGICTVCENAFFHSYRAEGELSGRNGAIISLK